ncbi:hypothetical protein AAZV13_15G226100 [Glycine max]
MNQHELLDVSTDEGNLVLEVGEVEQLPLILLLTLDLDLGLDLTDLRSLLEEVRHTTMKISYIVRARSKLDRLATSWLSKEERLLIMTNFGGIIGSSDIESMKR